MPVPLAAPHRSWWRHWSALALLSSACFFGWACADKCVSCTTHRWENHRWWGRCTWLVSCFPPRNRYFNYRQQAPLVTSYTVVVTRLGRAPFPAKRKGLLWDQLFLISLLLWGMVQKQPRNSRAGFTWAACPQLTLYSTERKSRVRLVRFLSLTHGCWHLWSKPLVTDYCFNFHLWNGKILLPVSTSQRLCKI